MKAQSDGGVDAPHEQEADGHRVSLPLALLALIALLVVVALAMSGLAGPLGAGSVNVNIRPP